MSIPTSTHNHNPPVHKPPVDKSAAKEKQDNRDWEEGESELGSQDDEDAEGSSESEDNIQSPYLPSHRPPARITLRLNNPVRSPRKNGIGISLTEKMAVDQREVGSSAEMIQARNGSDEQSQQSARQRSVSCHSLTPPGSPLRSFIAPAAGPAVAGPSTHPTLAGAAATLPPRLSKTHPAKLPPAHTTAGPSKSRADVEASTRSADNGIEQHTSKSVGPLWKTQLKESQAPAASKNKEKAGARDEADVDAEGDVEMGSEGGNDERDELESEYNDEELEGEDDEKVEDARKGKKGASNIPPKAPARSRPRPVVTTTSPAKDKPKRVTRGPGKKTKAKTKDKEKVDKVDTSQGGTPDNRSTGKAESLNELDSKDMKGESAYEYVPVTQVSFPRF